MRKKEKPITPGNNISKIIIELLKQKQGDTSLYNISKSIGMQQGTLRRKLENPTGWREIELINNLLNYFNVSYNKIFDNSETINSDVKYMAKLEEEIERLNFVISDMISLSEIVSKKFNDLSKPKTEISHSFMKLPPGALKKNTLQESEQEIKSE